MWAKSEINIKLITLRSVASRVLPMHKRRKSDILIFITQSARILIMEGNKWVAFHIGLSFQWRDKKRGKIKKVVLFFGTKWWAKASAAVFNLSIYLLLSVLTDSTRPLILSPLRDRPPNLNPLQHSAHPHRTRYLPLLNAMNWNGWIYTESLIPRSLADPLTNSSCERSQGGVTTINYELNTSYFFR